MGPPQLCAQAMKSMEEPVLWLSIYNAECVSKLLMFASAKTPTTHATIRTANVTHNFARTTWIRITAKFRRDVIGARKTQLVGRCVYRTLDKMHASYFLMSVTGINTRGFVSKVKGKSQIWVWKSRFKISSATCWFGVWPCSLYCDYFMLNSNNLLFSNQNGYLPTIFIS